MFRSVFLRFSRSLLLSYLTFLCTVLQRFVNNNSLAAVTWSKYILHTRHNTHTITLTCACANVAPVVATRLTNQISIDITAIFMNIRSFRLSYPKVQDTFSFSSAKIFRIKSHLIRIYTKYQYVAKLSKRLRRNFLHFIDISHRLFPLNKKCFSLTLFASSIVSGAHSFTTLYVMCVVLFTPNP